MRTTTRLTSNRKGVYAEMIGKFQYIIWPIDKYAVRFWVRDSVARAFRANDTNTRRLNNQIVR